MIILSWLIVGYLSGRKMIHKYDYESDEMRYKIFSMMVIGGFLTLLIYLVSKYKK